MGSAHAGSAIYIRNIVHKLSLTFFACVQKLLFIFSRKWINPIDFCHFKISNYYKLYNQGITNHVPLKEINL